MKKTVIVGIIFFLIIVISLAILIGCGNYNFAEFEYTFTKAYVKIGEEWKDLEISAWTDHEGEQLQLRLPNGTVMVVSSINCILYEGKLPTE